MVLSTLLFIFLMRFLGGPATSKKLVKSALRTLEALGGRVRFLGKSNENGNILRNCRRVDATKSDVGSTKIVLLQTSDRQTYKKSLGHRKEFARNSLGKLEYELELKFKIRLEYELELKSKIRLGYELELEFKIRLDYGFCLKVQGAF